MDVKSEASDGLSLTQELNLSAIEWDKPEYPESSRDEKEFIDNKESTKIEMVDKKDNLAS